MTAVGAALAVVTFQPYPAALDLDGSFQQRAAGLPRVGRGDHVARADRPCLPDQHVVTAS